MKEAPAYIALSGGVGGAKLLLGLARVLPRDAALFVANTADDFVHHGLNICPDLDTVLYTLAGWNNPELGWGQADETWQFLAALERLGGQSWFRLGDRDLATHIVRTEMLRQGKSLSHATAHLARQMGIAQHLAPMSDDPVATLVHTQEQGDLAFQEYFVQRRCRPQVSGFTFAGIEAAKPSPAFAHALGPALKAVLVGPSNPFVSIDPILALPGVKARLMQLGRPLVIVSNIVGGQALKGPAAKMMQELKMPQTALGVAQHYQARHGALAKGFVLDERDRALAPQVEALGMKTRVVNTVMRTLDDRMSLAKELLAFADSLAGEGAAP